MINVVLSGATGKVGLALAEAIAADPALTVHASTAPSLGVGLAEVLEPGGADVVVDFTEPGFAAEACRLCDAARVPLVLGTTGLSPAELEQHGAHAAAARSEE